MVTHASFSTQQLVNLRVLAEEHKQINAVCVCVRVCVCVCVCVRKHT